MRLVQNAVEFSFSYTAFDQAAGLFVAFSVYDITTGSAVFVTKVTAIYSSFGTYNGVYTGSGNKTYLVVGVVYTGGTYLVVDTNRAPTSECIQVAGSTVSYLAFDYAAYDQNNVLFVQSSIYDLTSGAPIFVSVVPMVHVFAGVYFGVFTGVFEHTYQIPSVVYTDGTYVVVDPLRAPGCESFDCIFLGSGGVSIDPGIGNVREGVSYEINNAPLIGTLKVVSNQIKNATLVGQSLKPTLG